MARSRDGLSLQCQRMTRYTESGRKWLNNNLATHTWVSGSQNRVWAFPPRYGLASAERTATLKAIFSGPVVPRKSRPLAARSGPAKLTWPHPELGDRQHPAFTLADIEPRARVCSQPLMHDFICAACWNWRRVTEISPESRITT